MVDGTFERGLMLYGVPVVGTPAFKMLKLREVKDQIVRDARRTVEVLATERQAMWSVLRLSTQQRFQYTMQLVPPSLCETVAAELDEELWRMFESTTGLTVPRNQEQGGLCLRVPVPGLDHRSFQEWAVRLPVRLYGWGLRSLADSCGPAYLGALETALPYMAGLGKVCPELAELWGGEECWSAAASQEDRWRTVLESGCSQGGELRRLWGRVQQEAQGAATWLGIQVPEVLATSVEGIGLPCACEESSVPGAIRGRVVAALENLRTKVLSKTLSLVRPKKTRAAWAWRQMDKVACAWRLALPGGDTTLTNKEFSEAAATALCLPSPACHGRVGEIVRGQTKIDLHGDNVQATALLGDHWLDQFVEGLVGHPALGITEEGFVYDPSTCSSVHFALCTAIHNEDQLHSRVWCGYSGQTVHCVHQSLPAGE